MKRNLVVFSLIALTLWGCNKNEQDSSYMAKGRVVNSFGEGLPNTKIYYNDSAYVMSNAQGFWMVADLNEPTSIIPESERYVFSPAFAGVKENRTDLHFSALHSSSDNELGVLKWINEQQLPNGLLESVENGNIVSLYDNALAALVFIMQKDFEKAELVFDFFSDKIERELSAGVGGFYQFRSRNGIPYGNRWMGDNAWLLLALNNYKYHAQSKKYNDLANELNAWLRGLQDTDGGLWAGYRSNGELMDYKVTEGNIDAFSAVNGFDSFHIAVLSYLEKERWDSEDKNLVAWPENPKYLYALDNQSWSYCTFKHYPVSALTTAKRFITTQTATATNTVVTGYDIDEDLDAIFVEGTGQMALAFKIAGLVDESDFYLAELDKMFIDSKVTENAKGLPYASNLGTAFGNEPYWTGADTNIALSAGAWYVFAKYGFNPFKVDRDKPLPTEYMFWLD